MQSVNSYSTQIKSTKSYQTESAQTESDVYKEAEATNQLFTSPQPINANVSRSIYGKVFYYLFLNFRSYFYVY